MSKPSHARALAHCGVAGSNDSAWSAAHSNLVDCYREIHAACVAANLCREGEPLDPEAIRDAGHKLAELQESAVDYDIEDSDRLRELRNAIDERIGWRNQEEEDGGDYLERIRQMGQLLNELEDLAIVRQHDDIGAEFARLRAKYRGVKWVKP